ncbi:far upstream element-binding protein 3-like isoform X4 [Mastacembelus armatus]|uniref:far upstream element-binding protein 3-like isoform X4 n=1 Tax=Mastacembelus armatus TaxID=205130 RepID=UPI000E4586DB|nr:far upstream element-binding protein 3-like isoform X4 [Mastacembelus armatus]
MMAELVQGQASMNQPGLKSEGLADVLQRARQIVGKMGGEAMSHLNSSSGSVESSLYYPGQKRPGEDGGNQLAAMGHQSSSSRVITEDYKVPDRMVGFIIGRGGEQITRIQLESGCKIQIAADSGGLMERPCSLTGTPESIEHAKRLLVQIVDRCRNGPGFHSDGEGGPSVQEMLIPASKVGLVIGRGGDTIKQLQERAGVKMMMIQDGPMPTGADKPLRISGDPYKVQAARELVLEVIREKDGDFRSGRNDFSARLGGTSVDVQVPRFAVGIVIGRNGEMIKKIQNDAGVRIQFKADDGISPERVAMVMGQADRCQHAVHLINDLIQTAQERDGFGSALRGGWVRGRGDWTMGSPGPLQEVTYTIPADKCGLVIGKGGETIKSINQQSGAHVELQRNPPPSTDPNTRVFTIRGTAQQMELARQLIDDKIGGSGIMSNGGFGFSPFTQGPATHQNCGSGQTFLTGVWGNTYQTNWQSTGQQDPGQQNQPQSMMTDYSKAWEDYYKKQNQSSQQSSVQDYTAVLTEYYRQQPYLWNPAQIQDH